jgi:hypothetical protein
MLLLLLLLVIKIIINFNVRERIIFCPCEPAFWAMAEKSHFCAHWPRTHTRSSRAFEFEEIGIAHLD